MENAFVNCLDYIRYLTCTLLIIAYTTGSNALTNKKHEEITTKSVMHKKRIWITYPLSTSSLFYKNVTGPCNAKKQNMSERRTTHFF